MRLSRAEREQLDRVLGLCARLAPALAAIGAGGLGLFYSAEMLAAAGALFAAGIVSFCALVLACRFYRPGLSLPLWAGLMTIALSVPMLALVLPSVRVGALHPLAALSAMTGWYGLGVTGPVLVFHSRLRRWLLG